MERMCNFAFYGEQQQYKREPFTAAPTVADEAAMASEAAKL